MCGCGKNDTGRVVTRHFFPTLLLICSEKGRGKKKKNDGATSMREKKKKKGRNYVLQSILFTLIRKTFSRCLFVTMEHVLSFRMLKIECVFLF